MKVFAARRLSFTLKSVIRFVVGVLKMNDEKPAGKERAADKKKTTDGSAKNGRVEPPTFNSKRPYGSVVRFVPVRGKALPIFANIRRLLGYLDIIGTMCIYTEIEINRYASFCYRLTSG